MISYLKNITRSMITTGVIVLLVFYSVNSFSQDTSALDNIISYKARNIDLSKALLEIGKIAGYEFSYNSDLIETSNQIKINIENISLRDLLNEVLNDSTLIYKVVDKQIVICKNNSFNQLLSYYKTPESFNTLKIEGTIIDFIGKKALPFANVSLLGKSIGTISNEQGRFNLKLPFNNLTDTLVVSYIGYKNALIPVRQLSTGKNIIYLKEDPFKIQEIVIRGSNAEKILQQALNKIKDNYYTDPYYITSFYREIVKDNDELASITEAVIDVYKSPYSGLFSDQIKLVKSRKNKYYTRDDTVSLKLQGGMSASLYLDLIKNPSNFLIKEHFKYFKYKLNEIVNYNNSSAYVISFEPKYYIENNLFEGSIYIDTDDLAIVAIEFNLTPDGLKHAGQNLIVQRSFRTRVKAISASYLINYREINNKYFIYLARGELEFKVKFTGKLFSTDFKTVFEFAANNIDTTDVKRFKRIETISPKKVFIDENYNYDQQFWGEYNYIIPDETMEEALIRIQQKLDNAKEEKE
ncbi:MAG: DUF5686 and carboxypeptidase regulatory-like domain-containing protein [Bacteroidales bacterium]|nr:DUF5686 and carboxypeptidase regulatory-like domain-containing protein [Bacteroidales bacterium]